MYLLKHQKKEHCQWTMETSSPVFLLVFLEKSLRDYIYMQVCANQKRVWARVDTCHSEQWTKRSRIRNFNQKFPQLERMDTPYCTLMRMLQLVFRHLGTRKHLGTGKAFGSRRSSIQPKVTSRCMDTQMMFCKWWILQSWFVITWKMWDHKHKVRQVRNRSNLCYHLWFFPTNIVMHRTIINSSNENQSGSPSKVLRDMESLSWHGSLRLKQLNVYL